ncbi:hypothetical protein QQP08_023604 [Theobroma cacao]|nr:hypothetical protein QQP08_023604 [Theobroma cacao]
MLIIGCNNPYLNLNATPSPIFPSAALIPQENKDRTF